MPVSNTIRARSVSRSRITVIDPGDANNECLDPAQLLDSVLSKVTTLDIPLVVTVSDTVTSVSYPLAIFTAKLWPIRKGFVIFGLKKIKFRDLKAKVTVEIQVETENGSPANSDQE